MPANTPNRGYPYSLPADAVDIPGDIQRLAEAIDTDLATLTATIPTRPAMRLRGTDAFLTSTDTAVVGDGTSLPFDTEDFNTGITYTQQTNALGAASPTRSVRLTQPGIYFVMGTVAYPRPTSGTNRVKLGAYLKTGAGTGPVTRRARTETGLQPSASDGIRTLSVSTVLNTAILLGSGYISLWFHSHLAAGGVDTYTVTERTLTVIRMNPTP